MINSSLNIQRELPALRNTQQAEILKNKLKNLIDQEPVRYSTFALVSVIEGFMPQAQAAINAGMICRREVENIIDDVCYNEIGRRSVEETRYSQDFLKIRRI